MNVALMLSFLVIVLASMPQPSESFEALVNYYNHEYNRDRGNVDTEFHGLVPQTTASEFFKRQRRPNAMRLNAVPSAAKMLKLSARKDKEQIDAFLKHGKARPTQSQRASYKIIDMRPVNERNQENDITLLSQRGSKDPNYIKRKGNDAFQGLIIINNINNNNNANEVDYYDMDGNIITGNGGNNGAKPLSAKPLSAKPRREQTEPTRRAFVGKQQSYMNAVRAMIQPADISRFAANAPEKAVNLAANFNNNNEAIDITQHMTKEQLDRLLDNAIIINNDNNNNNDNARSFFKADSKPSNGVGRFNGHHGYNNDDYYYHY